MVQYLHDHHAEFMYLNKERPLLGTDKIDSVPGYRAKVNGMRCYYPLLGRGIKEGGSSFERSVIGNRPLRSRFEGWPNCEGLE